MPNPIYLAGLKSNVLSRTSTITAVPTASTIYTTAGLFDGEPGNIFKFTSALTDSTIVVDTIIDNNQGFDVDGTPFPPGWTDISSGTGAIAKESSDLVRWGTNSLELIAGTSGVAGARQDVTMLPAETFTADGYLYGGTTNHVKLSIRNLQSGHYINAAGAWSTSLAFFVQQTSGTTWTNGNPTWVTMESYAVCGYNRTPTIRLEVVSTTASTGAGASTYADAIIIKSHVNFVSIHGHNIDPLIALKLQHDTASSFASPTTAHEFTVKQPAFYAKLTSSITERYIRILFSGTPINAPEIGELWMGQYKTLTDTPKYNYGIPVTMPSGENITASGRVLRTARAYHPTESLQMDFWATSTSIREEYVEMFDRGNWGVEPTVFVPYDAEPNVYLGVFPTVLSGTRPLKGLFDITGVTLQGFPFVKRIS